MLGMSCWKKRRARQAGRRWYARPNVADNRHGAAGRPGPAGENSEAGAGRPWLDCRGVSG